MPSSPSGGHAVIVDESGETGDGDGDGDEGPEDRRIH
jgi:hypothetical protein